MAADQLESTIPLRFERCPDCGTANLGTAERCRQCQRPFQAGLAWPGTGWLDRPQFRMLDFMVLVVVAALFTLLAKEVPRAAALVAGFLLLPLPFALYWANHLGRRGWYLDVTRALRVYARVAGLFWIIIGGIVLAFLWFMNVLIWIFGEWW